MLVTRSRVNGAVVLSALVALAVTAAACGSSPSTPQTSQTTRSSAPSHATTVPSSTPATTPSNAANKTLPAAKGGTTHPYWLLENFSIAPLLDAGLPVSLLQSYFNNPMTFVIVKAGSATTNQYLPDATYVMSFGNYETMQEAVNSGAVPSNIRYLLFDDEKWAATPANEQAQPYQYESDAENLAHQHGFGLIFTPAANLSTVLNPSYTNTTKYDGYVSLGIPTNGAKYANVLEIQSQQEEAQSGFVSFVDQAAAQAQAANPNVLVLAGLTTIGPARLMSPQLLLNDYDSTRDAVSGYWLNIPGGQGGPRDPQLAVQFLQQLAPQLGY
jgi:hypothetical protein